MKISISHFPGVFRSSHGTVVWKLNSSLHTVCENQFAAGHILRHTVDKIVRYCTMETFFLAASARETYHMINVDNLHLPTVRHLLPMRSSVLPPNVLHLAKRG